MARLARLGTKGRVRRFWRWWGAHRRVVLVSASNGDKRMLGRVLGPPLAGLSKDLEWQFRAGRGKAYRLAMSVPGAKTTRLVDAWCEAAPDDPDVEFDHAQPARVMDEKRP